MKYLVNVSSFEDLKAQYKRLAFKHHPDVGGSLEAMKELNNEYDILFPMWQNKFNTTASKPNTETAYGTRSQFYTQNGWQGKNYDMNLSTTEIAALIRAYVKEAYPLYKFSITRQYFSMGSSISVALMEAPHDAFVEGRAPKDGYVQNAAWYFKRMENNESDRYALTEQTIAVLQDVQRFIDSYNRSDCDGMIDYFDVNFYSHLDIGKWDKPFRAVEKTLRIKLEGKGIAEAKQSETYDIQEDVDTRDNSKIYVVKVLEQLSRDEYLSVNQFMKSIGGYYSKFKHGFLFRDDPSSLLTA